MAVQGHLVARDYLFVGAPGQDGDKGAVHVYTDRTAFRNFAIDMIKKSKFIGEWKPGMLDAINAM